MTSGTLLSRPVSTTVNYLVLPNVSTGKCERSRDVPTLPKKKYFPVFRCGSAVDLEQTLFWYLIVYNLF